MASSQVVLTGVLLLCVLVFVSGQDALKQNKTGSISNLKQVPPPDVSLDCGRRGSVPIFIFGGPPYPESVAVPTETAPLLFPKRRRKRTSVPLLPKDRPPQSESVAVSSGDVPLHVLQRQRGKTSVPFLPKDEFVGPGSVQHVAGGIPSSAHSWPWMVLLGKKRGPSVRFFCGGSLINNRYVLTAAHCTLDPAPFFVRVGEHGIEEADIRSRREDVEMENVIFHPNYNLSQRYYDMALIKLATPVQFRKEVKPVCLPWGQMGTEDLVGQRVTVTGWGAEAFGGRNSPTLREVDVEVFEPSRCQLSYATLPDFAISFPEGMSKDNIVCAGDLAGGKDSCQGDSGGPMVHGSNDTFTLDGVISKGYGCGKLGFPGLYAPLRHYETLQWIKTTAF